MREFVMKRLTVVLILLLTGSVLSPAATQPYSLQFVEVLNNGTNLDVKVQIKSSGAPFTLGTSNLVVTHGGGLTSPTLLAPHNFSDGVAYQPITITALPGDLASINIEYLGTPGSGATIPQWYVDVATIRFTITDGGQPVFFIPKIAAPSPRALVYQSDESTTNEASTNVRADVRVMLEGPYNTSAGAMNKSLNTAGHLAARFPSTSVPTNAVDSVSIEIRNAPSGSGSTTRKFRSAWLLTDGSIRDFADTTQQYLDFDTTGGNYYLVVRHANHLGVMTAASRALNALSSTPYRFTTGQSQAWGTDALKQVQSGVFALYAGDGNRSGVVTAADANGVFGSLNTTGYNLYDMNLTGVVTAADANVVFGNLNKSTQVPE